MKLSDFVTMRYLKPADIPQYKNVDAALIRDLDSAIPVIGPIIVTSTWRESTGSGASNSFHKRTPAIAVDFVLKSMPVWTAYKILKAKGFTRIGLRPDKNMIHLDYAYKYGLVNHPYYFLEDSNGADIGPIDTTRETVLTSVPGYAKENSSGAAVLTFFLTAALFSV